MKSIENFDADGKMFMTIVVFLLNLTPDRV